MIFTQRRKAAKKSLVSFASFAPLREIDSSDVLGSNDSQRRTSSYTKCRTNRDAILTSTQVTGKRLDNEGRRCCAFRHRQACRNGSLSRFTAAQRYSHSARRRWTAQGDGPDRSRRRCYPRWIQC